MAFTILKEPYAPGGVRTEVTGNKRAIIDGCDGVVDYSDDEVIIRAGRLKITVSGRDLQLKILTDCTAVVEGYFTNIHYGYL